MMIKLPTKEVIFYPKKMIKDVKAETLEICFKDGLEFKANKSRQQNGKWIRYDHRTITSSELVEIIKTYLNLIGMKLFGQMMVKKKFFTI